MGLQLTGMYKSSLAAIGRAHVRTVIVMDHLVVLQMIPLLEFSSAFRDGTFVRTLTRVNPFVPCCPRWMHRLTAPLGPAQHFPVIQSLPLRSPAPASMRRGRRT
jgi:hypothetical protein